MGPKDRSYSSTIAVMERSNFLNQLIENESKNIGVLLDIEFVITTQTDGFSYQTLLKVSEAEHE